MAAPQTGVMDQQIILRPENARRYKKFARRPPSMKGVRASIMANMPSGNSAGKKALARYAKSYRKVKRMRMLKPLGGGIINKPEYKWVDVHFQETAIDVAYHCAPVCIPIPDGAAHGGRTGSKITVTAVQVRGRVTPGDTPQNTVLRFVLVWDTMNRNTDLKEHLDDLFPYTDMTNPLIPLNTNSLTPMYLPSSKRFRIIFDYQYVQGKQPAGGWTVGGGFNPPGCFTFYKKENVECDIVDNQDPPVQNDPLSAVSNCLYAVFWSSIGTIDTVTQKPRLAFKTRVRYTDF